MNNHEQQAAGSSDTLPAAGEMPARRPAARAGEVSSRGHWMLTDVPRRLAKPEEDYLLFALRARRNEVTHKIEDLKLALERGERPTRLPGVRLTQLEYVKEILAELDTTHAKDLDTAELSEIIAARLKRDHTEVLNSPTYAEAVQEVQAFFNDRRRLQQFVAQFPSLNLTVGPTPDLALGGVGIYLHGVPIGVFRQGNVSLNTAGAPEALEGLARCGAEPLKLLDEQGALRETGYWQLPKFFLHAAAEETPEIAAARQAIHEDLQSIMQKIGARTLAARWGVPGMPSSAR